jgi:hypothetical protein
LSKKLDIVLRFAHKGNNVKVFLKE